MGATGAHLGFQPKDQIMNPASSHPHWLVVVQAAEASSGYYPLETAARLSGVHPDLLRYYCRKGLLGAERAQLQPETEPMFDDQALYDIRQLERLRRQHGVNLRALPLVWELSHEVQRLHAELRFVRAR